MTKKVSILVLMDIGIRTISQSQNEYSWFASFNPCFNGYRHKNADQNESKYHPEYFVSILVLMDIGIRTSSWVYGYALVNEFQSLF